MIQTQITETEDELMAYRVAVIGCGGISKVHAAVLNELDGVQLIAFADIIPEKAEKMAEQYHCHAYSCIEDLLDNEHPDAVHICTPHYNHTELCDVAAGKGIPVFTEKPPVIDREQWQCFQEIARQIPVGICFQNRFNGNVQEALRILKSGEMGKMIGIRAFVTWNRGAGYYRNNWRGKWATEGGGALINQAIHTLDLILLFLGKPETIRASMSNHHLNGDIEVEDTAEIWLRNENGTGLLYASTAYGRDEPVLIDIATERGNIRMENDRLTVVCDGKEAGYIIPDDEKLGKSYWGAGHKKCISDFYESLRNGRACRNDIESCRDTVETMLTVYEQCRDRIGQ